MPASLYSVSTLSSIWHSSENLPSLSSRTTTPELPSLESEPAIELYPAFRRVSHSDSYAYAPTKPQPVFPFKTNRLHYVPRVQEPHFADQWPIGFANDKVRIWNGRQYEIDRFLEYGRTIRNGNRMPWIPEYLFKGAAYRLTIDLRKSLIGLPIFTHGTIISVRNWNCHEYQYIVDHCIHKDKERAYLKVICFDSCDFALDIRSLRPPLILVVPLSHCNVRSHPNLMKTSPTRCHLNTRLDQTFRKFHCQRSLAFWNSIFLKKNWSITPIYIIAEPPSLILIMTFLLVIHWHGPPILFVVATCSLMDRVSFIINPL